MSQCSFFQAIRHVPASMIFFPCFFLCFTLPSKTQPNSSCPWTVSASSPSHSQTDNLCLRLIRVDRALIMSIRLMPKLGPLKTNKNPSQHGSSRNKAGDVRLRKKKLALWLACASPKGRKSPFIISPNTDHQVYQCLITSGSNQLLNWKQNTSAFHLFLLRGVCYDAGKYQKHGACHLLHFIEAPHNEFTF